MLHFDEGKLLVAYDQANRFAGIFITYADEEFSTQDLFDYFYDRQPNYLIVAAVPEVDEGLTVDNYIDKLEDLILELRENNTSSLDIEYYIPKTLH